MINLIFIYSSPESSILLVDWSSLSYIGQQSRRRGSKNDNNNNIPTPPIAAPVFLSLLTDNWGTARRWLFCQVLMGGKSSAETSKQGVLIEKRNERAIDVLHEYLRMSDQGNDVDISTNNREQKHISLLYGAGHCRDLHRRLIQEESMAPVRTEWRTAFRVTAPRWGDFINVDDWKAKTNDIASSLLYSMGDGNDIVKSMSA